MKNIRGVGKCYETSSFCGARSNTQTYVLLEPWTGTRKRMWQKKCLKK